MSLELIGGRILAPYFGSGIYVWGSIITIFMVSLSIGYLSGGRLSVKDPTFAKFGTIFIVGGSLLIPITFLANPVMEFIFLRVEDPRYGSLIASTFLFAIPTIILGMISPYSVRLLVEKVEQSGSVAGTLYFCLHTRKCPRDALNLLLFRPLVRGQQHHPSSYFITCFLGNVLALFKCEFQITLYK